MELLKSDVYFRYDSKHVGTSEVVGVVIVMVAGPEIGRVPASPDQTQVLRVSLATKIFPLLTAPVAPLVGATAYSVTVEPI